MQRTSLPASARQLVHPARRPEILGVRRHWVAREPSTGLKADYHFDFKRNRYYGANDGSALISGTLNNSPGNGLPVSNAGNKDGTAEAIAALANDWTMVIKFNDTSALGTQSCLLCFDTGGDAPIFILGFGGSVMGQARSYRTVGPIDTLDRFGPNVLRTVAVARSSAGRAIAQNGCPPITSATPHNAPSALQWFRYYNGSSSNYATGYIEEIILFKKRVSDSDLQVLSGPRIQTAPYAGSGCIRGEYNQYCSFGDNTLNWEYTQPWTFCCAVKMDTSGDSSGASLASVVYTNVSALSVFPGHELFFLSDLKPRVRLIHDIASSYIEVVAANAIQRGVWTFLGYENTGTGLASGIQIYTRALGGSLVVEPMTTVKDTLGGQSIVGGTQKLLFGNQYNRLGYNLMHFGDQPAWYSEVKGSVWWDTYSTPARLPPSSSDPKCELWADFNEPNGTTVIDYSGKGRNGTLTQGFMRVPG